MNELGVKVWFYSFRSKDLISNFLYFPPYNSHDFDLENMVLDQPIIPQLTVFFSLVASLLDIVKILRGEFFFLVKNGFKNHK